MSVAGGLGDIWSGHLPYQPDGASHCCDALPNVSAHDLNSVPEWVTVVRGRVCGLGDNPFEVMIHLN